MPPNRRNHHQQHNGAGHGGHGHGGGGGGAGNNQVKPIKCCVPTECLRSNAGIFLEDVGTADLEVVKVVCNNDHCGQSQYMHRECFEAWEQTVLTYLRSCGRARSWSEKQRLQNLWTKRGYDLAFKACSCKCGKGHLRKDLDWVPPPRQLVGAAPAGAAAAAAPAAPPANEAALNNNNNAGAAAAPEAAPAAAAAVPIPAAGGKKKKNKTKEPKPTLAISAPVPHPNNNHLNQNNNHHQHHHGHQTSVGTSAPAVRQQPHAPPIGSLGRDSSSSQSSTGSMDLGLGTSVSSSTSSSSTVNRPRVNSLSSTGSAASMSGVSGSPPSPGAQFGSPVANPGGLFRYRKNSLATDRVRHNSGSMFSRRLDFSSFNALPRHKLNSYHIKMEDEHNDETRTFVMNTLLQTKTNRISCVLCQMNLIIFDRYPLIDGTFFLTPRQHTKACLQAVMPDGRTQYLSAVCMSCLEGWSVNLYCRCCRSKWDGSSLILGSIYTYDVFAATPCCRERFSCTNCRAPVVHADQRPNFFSEYSRPSGCPNCGIVDYHLAKPLPVIFDKVSNVS